MRHLLTILPLAGALPLPVSASDTPTAASPWTLPSLVTPVAGDTLAIHNPFMVFITVLFVVVFAIMLYSMIRHRKAAGHEPARFSGPKGMVQWLWVMVPFAILLFVDFVLMGVPAFHAVIDMEDARTRADMAAGVAGRQWERQFEHPETGIKYVATMTTAPTHHRRDPQPQIR